MDEAFSALKAAGIQDEMLWHREPYSLSYLEKQLGKKTFQEIAGGHVVKYPGKPTLAPETDKMCIRDSCNAGRSIFAPE